MKNFVIAALAAILIAGCGTSKRVVREKVYVPAPTAVTIQSTAPYQEGHRIKRNILEECTLDRALPGFVKQYTIERNIDVETVDKLDPAGSGANLVIEIADAVSEGNAFIGHNKYTKIVGTLYQDGVKTASFEAARHSSGGAFAGFKGSCSVLGRTVKTLGVDVAEWLSKPWKNAYLGDL